VMLITKNLKLKMVGTLSLFIFLSPTVLLNYSQDKFVYIRPHLERVVSSGFLLERNCDVSFEAMRFNFQIGSRSNRKCRGYKK
jgi:hypothetical protein